MPRFFAVLAACLALTSPVLASDGESSFTPSSLYVPVRFLRLASSSDPSLSSQLYRCPSEPDPTLPPAGSGGDGSIGGSGGSTSTIANDSDAGTEPEVLDGDCLVDMADNAALAALFTDSIDIKPGTYDSIALDTCRAGASGYSSYVKGSIDLSGHTWYTTTANDAILTRSHADNSHVRIDFQGCGLIIKLPHAVTLAANDDVKISAFFSLRNIAWATLTSNGPPGGCTFDTQGHNVCTAYPTPIAYLGDDSPTVDTYFITEDQSDLDATQASGQMLILRDTTGLAFGGFSRRLYSAHSVVPSVNYDTAIKTLMLNSDGMTYLIENWGGGSNGVAVPYYVHFPAFELQTHNGTMTRSDGVTMVPYRAVKQ
jgi:hypothetical protein